MPVLVTSEIPFSISIPASPPPDASGGGKRRRHITPEAGRALEILGHAIEYLTDEYVHEGGSFAPEDSQWQAVQLLMGVNRQIFLACPVELTFWERVRSLLHLHLV